MKHWPITRLDVHLDGRQRIKVGRLASQGRRILFEYDAAFIASGIELSPFRLPLRSGVMAGDAGVFEGLYGVFNDSLPDGWGRLLLDRAIESLGLPRTDLTPLDRLAHVGLHGMGALAYEPDLSETNPGGSGREPVVLQLDRLAKETAIVLAGEEGPVLAELLRLNGGSAGARPKVVAQVSADLKRTVHGGGTLPDGYRHWMIKFPSPQDDALAGAVEYAYSLMARDAGLEMPQTHLFTANRKRYFGIERFDRDGDRRIHMHSLSGLLHADHRVPTLDYGDLIKATLLLTRDVTEAERAFRLACFNVLAHNRDDHAKNVSFLLDDATKQWRLAPAYDLTFSSGPGGEQSMLVMGEGKAPDATHLAALARKHDIKRGKQILDEVQAAIARWRRHADKAGVTAKPIALIAARIAPSTGETGAAPRPPKRPAKR